MTPAREPESLDTRRAATPSDVENAIAAAQRFLLSVQHADGHWCAELEGDTILESEYILTLYFLGRGQEQRIRKAAEYLRRQQLPGGGWAIYPGGPPEVSASVKAYFALKLAGDDADAPHMAKARHVILDLGGIDACNSFTRIYLSIFGQFDWSKCPAVPPELILLPDWFPFNIYRMSSWSRAIVVPLSIIWACKPYCPVPERASIRELWAHTSSPRRVGRRRRVRERLWRVFFVAIDRMLKLAERVSIRPFRKRALRKAEAWIRERLEESDGLGAIFPPIINTVLAFRCLGYAPDDPRLQEQVQELLKLELEDEDTLRIQPCFSAVWDTALALQGLAESDLAPDDPALLRAARWLLTKEVRRAGDWKRGNPQGEPGGWFFEYRNEFYPDTDDTAEVLTALSSVGFPEELEERWRRDAVERGLAWQLTMQNRDGGWGSFDKGCDNEVLTLIPFADHNAMIDPSCEDITGRTLEALHRLGFERSHPAVGRAAAFLKSRQDRDGAWYGRWGCNYIYGTWLALRGLRSAAEDMSQERYQRAAHWLSRHQNSDGGWGELPRSYDEPERKGIGPSTPSQTAWALLALFATGDRRSATVRRGIDYLLAKQQYDGSWKDEFWTGTGFPRVFYLRYHFYATYFPLWALAIYRREEGLRRQETQAAEGEAAVKAAARPPRSGGVTR